MPSPLHYFHRITLPLPTICLPPPPPPNRLDHFHQARLAIVYRKSCAISPALWIRYNCITYSCYCDSLSLLKALNVVPHHGTSIRISPRRMRIGPEAHAVGRHSGSAESLSRTRSCIARSGARNSHDLIIVLHLFFGYSFLLLCQR